MSSAKSSTNGSHAQAVRRNLGPVMAIGGAEAKDHERTILPAFLEHAEGGYGPILVIPTASEDPEGTAARYKAMFRKLDAGSVSVLNVTERSDANDDRAFQLVCDARAIYITGGDQARLVTLLVGTRVMEAIRERNAAGVMVAGTSAGASIIADHLIVGGSDLLSSSSDAVARRSLAELSAGFGLLRDAVTDQHFSARGRIGRLLSVFAATPGLVGLGIDEATAALVRKDGFMEVIGQGSITVLDGRAVVSDFAERRSGELLSLADVSLHVLGPGRRFDLANHRPIPFSETAYLGPSSEEVVAAALSSEGQ